MAFTDMEIEYIRSQPLARVATVSPDMQPDVVPVTFEFDGFRFYVGGFAPERTRRTKNVESGNDRVALVIDDLASLRPWAPRYIRIYGRVELVDRPGPNGPSRIMKITPTISWSLNLSGSWTPGSGQVLTPLRTEHIEADL